MLALTEYKNSISQTDGNKLR